MSLAYLSNPATYTQGTAIPNNTPANSGGAAVSYSVLPALPAGLTLNPVTGVISGTPTAVTLASSYSVTATNTGGSTSTLLSITVVSPYTAWATPYNLIQDLNGDDDGDGNSNHFEFIAGLDPRNPNSVFTVTLVPGGGLTNQTAIIFKPIISGRTYTVRSSNSLSPANWQPLSNATSSDTGNTRTVNDASTISSKKFYMIEISIP